VIQDERGTAWLAEERRTAASDVGWLGVRCSGGQITGGLSMQTSFGNGWRMIGLGIGNENGPVAHTRPDLRARQLPSFRISPGGVMEDAGEHVTWRT